MTGSSVMNDKIQENKSNLFLSFEMPKPLDYKNMHKNDIRQFHIWLNWNYEIHGDSKSKKVLVCPITRTVIDSEFSKSCVEYSSAEIHVRSNWSDGLCIGFKNPTWNNAVCGISIKYCSLQAEYAKRVIDLMQCYTEEGPDGNGYQLVFQVDITKLPKDYKERFYAKNPHNNIRCYVGGIFNGVFEYTGKVINNEWTVEDRTEQFMIFLDEFMRIQEKELQSKKFNQDENVLKKPNNPPMDILNKARTAKNGEKFIELYDKGIINSYENNTTKADIALCNILAFYCGGNTATIDQLFRKSKLYREKWEHQKYRDAVIKKAIKQCNGKFYRSPGRPPAINNSSMQSQNVSKIDLLTIDNLEQHLQANEITIRYNDIKNQHEITGLASVYEKPSLDILIPILYDKLQFIYNKVTDNRIRGFLNDISIRNRYNPVLDIIDNIEWDKTDRLPELYDVLGIKEDDKLSKTLVFKWMWQCLSMARNTLRDEQDAYGSDGVLVFIGPQGVGKTTFFAKLAIKQNLFYGGKHINFNDKDTIILATVHG